MSTAPGARRLAASLVALAIGVALALLTALQVSLASSAPSQTSPGSAANSADVVVDFGDGRVVVRRVTFISPTITSLDALRLTGLELGLAEFDFGAAVCAVETVGCAVDNCFCDSNLFWGLSRWQNGRWQASQVGARDSVVEPGTVDGWRWGSAGQSAPPLTPEYLAAQAGLQWLRARQMADGSYGNNAGATLDAILAVAAAHEHPDRWRGAAGGASLLDFAADQAGAFVDRPESKASAGKLALAVAAADLDPRWFGGTDLVQAMTSVYTPATGDFGSSNWDQTLSILGWAAAGEPVPVTATRTLANRANRDGGWGWNQSSESDVDTTALSIQALIAAGEPVTSTRVVSGLAFLKTAQNLDGGFPYSPTSKTDTRSNTNSTAFAVQAILAAGQDPLAASWAASTTVTTTHAISFLLSQQLPDGGFAFVEPPADEFATRQVIPALLGQTLIVRSQTVAQRKALDWIASQQQADGSFAGFNPGATVDAVFAIAAAGRDPAALTSDDGKTALDYLAGEAAGYAGQGPGAAGKLAAGAVVAALDPHEFGGVDLVEPIRASTSITSGQFGASSSTWDQAWAMLGLRAAGETIPVSATLVLEDMQRSDGGWSFDASADATDVDSTAMALQALAAAGRTGVDPAVQAGLAYLRRAQRPDGGFPGYDGATSASSTGLALQALASLSQRPDSLDWTRVVTASTPSASRLSRPTAVDALLSLQSPQGGLAGFAGANDPFSTYQAAPGLIGRSYPSLVVLEPADRARRLRQSALERLAELCSLPARPLQMSGLEKWCGTNAER